MTNFLELFLEKAKEMLVYKTEVTVTSYFAISLSNEKPLQFVVCNFTFGMKDQRSEYFRSGGYLYLECL